MGKLAESDRGQEGKFGNKATASVGVTGCHVGLCHICGRMMMLKTLTWHWCFYQQDVTLSGCGYLNTQSRHGACTSVISGQKQEQVWE